MVEPKSRLENVNQPDKVLEAVDRRSAWAGFLPLKMRLSIGVASLLVTSILLEDRVLNRGEVKFSWMVYAAIFGVTLLLGGMVTLFDHFATRRRRASKRPPASFS